MGLKPMGFDLHGALGVLEALFAAAVRVEAMPMLACTMALSGCQRSASCHSSSGSW